MTSLSEANLPSLDAQREYWNDRWQKHPRPNYFQSRRAAAVLGLIDELGLKDPQILDYGCGIGFFTAELSKIAEAIGVDLSEGAIEEARRRYPETTFIAANLFELSMPERQFDLIVSQEVIAHVMDQADYVARIAKMLKPGGYLVLTTANPIVMNRLSEPPQPHGHIHQWLSLRDLRRLLVPSFEMLKHTTIMPRGDRGFLRIVNSSVLHAVLWRLFTGERVQRFKEWAGWGYTIIVVARLRQPTPER
jgi:2-polyprenyl-3-methyl-5-hydroxy-6-metoxy-1,4-benzoquinol methylase